MNIEENCQKAKELRHCFKCLSEEHQARTCTVRLSNVNACRKLHHILLHQPYKTVEQNQSRQKVEDVSNLSSMRRDRVLPVTPESEESGRESLKTISLFVCGGSPSFMEERHMKALNLVGQPVDLNVAGNHGTSDSSSKRMRVKTGDQDRTVDENITAYGHPNVIAGNPK